MVCANRTVSASRQRSTCEAATQCHASSSTAADQSTLRGSAQRKVEINADTGRSPFDHHSEKVIQNTCISRCGISLISPPIYFASCLQYKGDVLEKNKTGFVWVVDVQTHLHPCTVVQRPPKPPASGSRAFGKARTVRPP